MVGFLLTPCLRTDKLTPFFVVEAESFDSGGEQRQKFSCRWLLILHYPFVQVFTVILLCGRISMQHVIRVHIDHVSWIVLRSKQLVEDFTRKVHVQPVIQ